MNIAPEERRDTIVDKQIDCKHGKDEKADSPQKLKQDETLREVEIASSDWISERLYQMSNRESSQDE